MNQNCWMCGLSSIPRHPSIRRRRLISDRMRVELYAPPLPQICREDKTDYHQVEAWKLRGHLPHAVEATALLTDAILHDDSTHNSVFSIRATYAAAFSRFVTGLVDTKLGSGGGGGTMFNRAAMIGLPLSFVELRHEAAHRELPSLVLLRNYTNRALEWLWDYYWARIDRGVSFSAAGENGSRVRVKSLLQQFSQQVQSDNSRKRVKSLATSVSQSLVSICKGDVEGAKVICRVLLEDGFLVPRNRQWVFRCRIT